jgi:hypothetical protein
MNDKSSNLYALKRLDVSSEYNLERVLRRAYIKESTLLSKLLGRFFVQLDSFLKFKRKLIHGYWLMNWIKRKRNRQMLRKVRGGADHISSIEAPLVSVIIPTYNRGQLLVKRAIPSVLNQTYQNFEIVIVGDHCTDDTQVLVQEIDDKRVSFHNLPTRSCYPANSRDRKLVAGATAANKALELSRGDWITRLDDDDEFSNNHIEALLKYALRCKYEFVYGRVEIEAAPNQWVIIGSYPPRCGQMTNIGVLYNSRLRFFGYDVLAWKYAEPDDWNLFRRMIEAGVRVGFIDEVVGRAYLGKRKNRLS